MSMWTGILFKCIAFARWNPNSFVSEKKMKKKISPRVTTIATTTTKTIQVESKLWIIGNDRERAKSIKLKKCRVGVGKCNRMELKSIGWKWVSPKCSIFKSLYPVIMTWLHGRTLTHTQTYTQALLTSSQINVWCSDVINIKLKMLFSFDDRC